MSDRDHPTMAEGGRKKGESKLACTEHAVGNSCIFVTLSHDCDIKHTCT